jgi:hypothetical protein
MAPGCFHLIQITRLLMPASEMAKMVAPLAAVTYWTIGAKGVGFTA